MTPKPLTKVEVTQREFDALREPMATVRASVIAELKYELLRFTFITTIVMIFWTSLLFFLAIALK
jgi:hypothetical protein